METLMRSCLVIFICCIFSRVVYCEFKEVNIQSGIVRGKSELSIYDAKQFYSFRGIPFANPPTGRLRFLPPQAVTRWNGVLNATEYRSECLQIKTGVQGIFGDEDCLYINVFTPDTAPSAKLPVMIFIYGGGFTQGSGDDLYFGPDFFMEKHVILVTFNYRLSVLGFMSLGERTYSGNMGLKDCHFALQWVQSNIEAFGGDKTKVTIAGHSAGAKIAELLATSPRVSTRLFTRVILQGLPMGPMVVGVNKDHRAAMMEYAHSSGATHINTNEELLEFLLQADAVQLLRYTNDFAEENDYYPIVEYVGSRDIILPNIPEYFSPVRLQNVDLLVMYNTHEYFFRMQEFINNPLYVSQVNRNIPILLPNRNFQFSPRSIEHQFMVNDIRDYYLDNREITLDTMFEYVRMLSDALFIHSTDVLAKVHARRGRGNTFYARFGVDGQLNVLKTMLNLLAFNMTTHGDELCYIFKCDYFNTIYPTLADDSLERVTIERMISLWTNFVKYGNPAPQNQPVEWKPITTRAINFLDITNDGLRLGQNPNGAAVLFWDNLFIKFRRFTVRVRNSNRAITIRTT